MRNSPANPPAAKDRPHRLYVLGGNPDRCRQDRARAAYRRDSDRQSRRHHSARARDARGRRFDRLRGYAGHAQAPRSLRHRHPAHALSRPQCRHCAAQAPCTAWPTAPPWRWFPTPARRLCPIPDFKLVRAAQEAGHMVTALPGASARSQRSPSPVCRPTNSCSRAFCRPKRPHGAPASPSLLAFRPRSVLFETGPRIAATLADLAAGLGSREAALCRELTKLHEEIRRGDLPTLAQSCARANCAASSSSSSLRRREQPAPGRRFAAARRARAFSLKDAVGEVAAGDRPAAPGPLSARAGADERTEDDHGAPR